MKVWNILAAIAGVVIIALGIWCMLTPVHAYLEIGWLVGLCMIIDGVGCILAWWQLRKQDMDSGWMLAAAIISIIVGVMLSISVGAQLAVDLFIATLMSIWLIVGGIMRIAAGFRLRAIHVKGGVESVGKRWWLTVILGVLVVIIGILSLFNPIVMMFGLGMFLGACIIMAGVSVVSIAAS